MNITRTLLPAATVMALVGSWVPVRAADEGIEYNRQIRPILSENCFACHGPDGASRQADLRLDDRDAAIEMSAIVPGKPDESEAIRRIFSDDPEEVMPPPDSRKNLTAKQKQLLRDWVAAGAGYQPHWSFIVPERPEPPWVPEAASADKPADKSDFRIRNEIDAFVADRLKREGMTMSPEADKATLLRRVTLDLTGLPPTLAELDAFLADESPEAYDRVVQRLLSSPRYGEHMARYWLDAAQYGDTHGMHQDHKRSLWPYRDWVIKAFNDNMPFDRFTTEQLAGDLLPDPTRDQRVATGFNRCNVTTSEGGSIAEEVLMRYCIDRVETSSTVWLGLTAGCAVCHDHKFDPLSQRECFQIYAFFNSFVEDAMDGNALAPPPALRLSTPEQEAQRQEYAGQIEALETRIKAELEKLRYEEPAADAPAEQRDARHSLAAWEKTERENEKSSLPAHIASVVRADAKDRTDEQRKLIRDYFLENVFAGARSQIEPLHQQLAEVRKQAQELDKTIPITMVTEEMDKRRPAFVLVRGMYNKKGDKVEPGVPGVLPPFPSDAPRNRLGLAKWLVAPSHPLTARVTVNRYWQRCFGRGLVETSEDFGTQGQPPSHPELLDWLATEFLRSGWDVKHMQRLIVTSATYRQTSNVTPDVLRKDPENKLLARGPRFRMDAEMIRDSALFVSGLLVERLGGPSVKPYQPPGLWEAISDVDSDTRVFQRDTGPGLYRRSLYTFWKRTSPPPSLSTFDAPSRETCTVRRSRTNTPLQALALMNDEQFVEAARILAERVMTSGGETPHDRATFAFRAVTSRRPKAEEVDLLVRQFETHLADYKADADAAEKLLSTGEKPRNAAMDVGDLAAWTMVCNLLLNLDEAVTKL